MTRNNTVEKGNVSTYAGVGMVFSANFLAPDEFPCGEVSWEIKERCDVMMLCDSCREDKI